MSHDHEIAITVGTCHCNTDLEDCAAVGLSVLFVATAAAAAAEDGAEALVERHLEVLAGVAALVVLGGQRGAALVVLGLQEEREPFLECQLDTGILSQIGTKLRDWAVGQAGAGCYSWAAMASNNSNGSEL